MELEQLSAISSETYPDLISQIEKEKGTVDVSTYLKQLDPMQHAVFDTAKRPDKQKKTEKGQETVTVARLPVSLQKLIVQRAAAFLCGNPIQLISQPVDDAQKAFLNVIQKLWDDNKLSYKSMNLAELMMSETECAELWYSVPAEPEYWEETGVKGASTKLRVRILAKSLGDDLYPIYDATGDMIAFGRGYSIKVGDKDVEHFDLYLPDKTALGVKSDNGWAVTTEDNPSGKIPVIYYRQPLPEWSDVQPLIERLETQVSNTADTNDYFGSPIIFVEGEVLGFADKGESGKVLKSKGGAKASYLTWDRSPESVKMENEALLKFIYNLTDTPNISLDEMKSLGTFSGIALKMLFLGAHLKAARKEGIFGESIQRRINFLKAAAAKMIPSFEKSLRLVITPKFEYFLPKNDQEIIEMITTAVGPGTPVMSQQTAVRNNPMVEDADVELELLQEQGSLGTDIATA